MKQIEELMIAQQEATKRFIEELKIFRLSIGLGLLLLAFSGDSEVIRMLLQGIVMIIFKIFSLFQ